MLAQLGGITTVLVNSFRVIVSFFNYNNFVSYLASKFYQIKNSQLNDMTLSTPQAKLTASPLVTSKCGNLKELFMHKLLPKICVCRCCRLNKMQRGVAEARVALYKEINIPEIIKLHRFLKLSLLHLLPPEKLKEIDKQVSSIVIDPDRDKDEEENLITNWSKIVNDGLP